jgi:histidinol-phosphate aminotransferase
MSIKKIYRVPWNSIPRSKNLLFLDKNENHDLNLRKINKKFLKILDSINISSYPDLTEVYKKLSNFLEIEKQNLFLTAGSDDGIRSIFFLLVNPGDRIIITRPTFAMYSIYCDIFKAKKIEVNYVNQDNKIIIDVKKILFLLKTKKPKLICLPNPDSPTGHVFNESELLQILNLSHKVSTFVLIDEAYNLYYKKSYIKLINKYSNLFITRSAGKAFGLAGLRIGYVISSKKNISNLFIRKPMYEINSIGSKIFLEALKKRNFSKIKKSVNMQLSAKTFFKEELSKLNISYLENEGNFIHIKLIKNRNLIINSLKKIMYFRAEEDHKCLKGYSRISLTNKKSFQKIIKIIKIHTN